MDALRQTLLNAKRVAYSQGASGVYISTTLFKDLGISEQMKSKSVVIEGKELVGTALARGDADLGMQQVSELKVTPVSTSSARYPTRFKRSACSPPWWPNNRLNRPPPNPSSNT
ncbi:hypothetical protein QNM99_15905 [Pseudomonas sp. PCH446]